jgi:amino acid adenylation domain-containing protein
MIINLLGYLENSSIKFKNKIAVEEANKKLSFSQLKFKSQKIGSLITSLFNAKFQNQPIVIFLPKSIDALISFFGSLYSGNFYVPIDTNSPPKRISQIIKTLRANCLITKKKYKNIILKSGYRGKIIFLDKTIKKKGKEKNNLTKILESKIDLDPVYAIPTSGTTGVPKLVLISHRSVIDYIEWAKKCYKITNKETMGNQAPFYFDNSTLDIYLMLSTGCKLIIIPEEKFTYPVELIKYLNLKKITIVFWVPSALVNIANFDALKNKKLKYLKSILFAGEVMPNKHLNYWRKKNPKILYSNLYGPTEITVDCTYYIVKKKFKDEDSLPIGFPCRNSNILILNKKRILCKINEIGELCVRGSSLALGYYNDEKRTKEVFIQNPLNSSYDDKIYLTGDLVFLNKEREIIFVGRKDDQIKHLGYRIELSEIENAALKIRDVKNVCVLYNSQKKIIALFYLGKTDKKKIYLGLINSIPKYMLPSKFISLKKFPLNSNGKIDKKKLARKI